MLSLRRNWLLNLPSNPHLYLLQLLLHTLVLSLTTSLSLSLSLCVSILHTHSYSNLFTSVHYDLFSIVLFFWQTHSSLVCVWISVYNPPRHTHAVVPLQKALRSAANPPPYRKSQFHRGGSHGQNFVKRLLSPVCAGPLSLLLPFLRCLFPGVSFVLDLSPRIRRYSLSFVFGRWIYEAMFFYPLSTLSSFSMRLS